MTAGLIGIGLFLVTLGVLGTVMCILLRIPIRGRVFHDPTEPPQGLAFRGLTRLGVLGTAMWSCALLTFIVGV